MKRKFIKRRLRRKVKDPGLPMAMLPDVAKIFYADPGRFAGNPREFARRELKRSVEERNRREARV